KYLIRRYDGVVLPLIGSRIGYAEIASEDEVLAEVMIERAVNTSTFKVVVGPQVRRFGADAKEVIFRAPEVVEIEVGVCVRVEDFRKISFPFKPPVEFKRGNGCRPKFDVAKQVRSCGLQSHAQACARLQSPDYAPKIFRT